MSGHFCRFSHVVYTGVAKLASGGPPPSRPLVGPQTLSWTDLGCNLTLLVKTLPIPCMSCPCGSCNGCSASCTSPALVLIPSWSVVVVYTSIFHPLGQTPYLHLSNLHCVVVYVYIERGCDLRVVVRWQLKKTYEEGMYDMYVLQSRRNLKHSFEPCNRYIALFQYMASFLCQEWNLCGCSYRHFASTFSSHHWPIVPDEEWNTPKRPSSTVAIQHSSGRSVQR